MRRARGRRERRARRRSERGSRGAERGAQPVGAASAAARQVAVHREHVRLEVPDPVGAVRAVWALEGLDARVREHVPLQVLAAVAAVEAPAAHAAGELVQRGAGDRVRVAAVARCRQQRRESLEPAPLQHETSFFSASRSLVS